MVGYGTAARVLDALEGILSDADYLAGGAFSVADVYVGSQIGFSMMFGTMEKRPAFEHYVGRIMGRPAAIRAREADDASVPAKAG